MAKRKPTNKYYFSVEGETEQCYLKWLQGTLNKKLCILELGVDFTFPQVIRFPFEKTAFYNKKATFVRVNSRFPQLEAELAAEGRAISIAESPVEILLK